MYTHPTITAALAEQHRRDLMSQASAARQARAARQGSSRNPARRPLIIRALRTAAAAISAWTWKLSAFIFGRSSRIVAIWSATSTRTNSPTLSPPGGCPVPRAVRGRACDLIGPARADNARVLTLTLLKLLIPLKLQRANP